MHAANITKEYLEGKSIPCSCQSETVYRYHVDLDDSSRVSGCEMVIRTAGKNAVLSAVLPIAVRAKEARGVVRTLANYNRERLDKDMDGVFELDYLRGRIQFTLQVCDVEDAADLSGEIDYCLEQIQNASNTMMRLVCDESEIVYEEEQAKLEAERKEAERQRKAELRAERAANAKSNPLLGKVMSFLGLDSEQEEYSRFRLVAPNENNADETEAEQAPAAQTEESKAEETKEEVKNEAAEA